VRAEWKQKGLEKFSEFLEEKRNSSTSENQNNGLVLLFRGEEELSVMLAAWQATGHNDLMLDTVKGFGCLDTYMEVVRNNKRIECSCHRVGVNCSNCDSSKKLVDTKMTTGWHNFL
jgi:hypothetical protein